MAAPYTTVIWSDDFSGATSGALLYNRVNSGKQWATDGAFQPDKDGPILDAGGFVKSVNNGNGAICTIPTNTNNYRVRLTFVTNGGSLNNANMVAVKAADKNNFIVLAPYNESGWDLQKSVGNAANRVRAAFINPNPAPTASATTSTALEVVEDATTFNIKCFANGVQIGDAAGYTIQKSDWAGGLLDNNQKAGFWNKGATTSADSAVTLFEILGDPVAAESITINNNAYGRRVFQRAHGTTAGTVTAAGTYTGTPASIECRIVSYDGATVISNWSTTGVTFSAGTWALSRSGIAQGGWYKVEARHSNNTAILVSSADKVGVGIGLVVYGQSNADGFMTRANASVPAANDKTIWYSGTAWGDTPAVNGVRQALNKIATKLGIPVFAAGAALGATASGGFVKGQTTYTTLMSRITAMGGKIEWVVYIQGESDSSATTWTTNVTSIRDTIASDTGITAAQLKFGIVLVPRIENPTTNGVTVRHPIHKAQYNLSQTTGFYLLGGMIDLEMAGDQLHPTGNGQDKAGQRVGQSIAFYEGAATYSGRGPKLIQAAVTGQYIDLTFDLGGQTGLALSDGTGAFAGIEVSNNDFATTIPIVSVTPGSPAANKARLDMGSASLTGTIKIRILNLDDPLDDTSKILVGTPL